ncbi:MAG: YbgA family protein [Bacillota bacterium]|nr:YbgA family protein [Bacillota bacterium]
MDALRAEELKRMRLSTREANLAFTPGPGRPISRLEDEWGRYKYAVLERSQRAYDAIRDLLKDKDGYPVVEFYRLVDEAATAEPVASVRANAAQHVWGHLKKRVPADEKRAFVDIVGRYLNGKIPIEEVKDHLWSLALRYDERYLRDAYYFIGL